MISISEAQDMPIWICIMKAENPVASRECCRSWCQRVSFDAGGTIDVFFNLYLTWKVDRGWEREKSFFNLILYFGIIF
jgi:hypothetical protein